MAQGSADIIPLKCYPFPPARLTSAHIPAKSPPLRVGREALYQGAGCRVGCYRTASWKVAGEEDIGC